MAEYRLDIIGSAEGLTKGLQDAQATLQELGKDATQAGKDTQAAFANNTGVEFFNKSIKDQFIFLGKTEVEVRKLQKALKTAFDPKEVATLNAQLKATTDSIIKLDAEIDNTIVKTKTLRGQIRENKNALGEMELAGLDATEAFETLSIETARLEDQMNDVNERVKFFASDTKGFDGLIAVTKLATAGFAVAQGTAALFGEENEDVQKTLLKVNAAMAILNGLQEIQNFLQKENAARIAITTALAKVKIFFIGAETVATQGLTVSQLAAANAAKILRVALISLGIGAIIVGLVALANAMGAFGDATAEANEELEKQAERLDKLNAKFKEGDDQILAMAARRSEVEKARLKLAGATNDEIINEDIKFLNQKKTLLEMQYVENKHSAEAQKKIYDELAQVQSEIVLKGLEKEQDHKDKADEAAEERAKKEKERLKALAKLMIEESKRLNAISEDLAKKANATFNSLFAGPDNNGDEITEARLSLLDDLEKIKLLELDIEFESGEKSLAEAKRIAKAKLDVEIEFAEQKIALLEASGGSVETIRALQLAVQKGKNELKRLAEDGDNSDFLKAIGLGDITPQELDNIKANLKTVADSVKSIFSDMINTSIDANQELITNLDKQIETVTKNIEIQAELGNAGRENNLAQERQHLGRLESERRDAFEKDKKLQKQRLNLDAATQFSSLVTASANIFKATSDAGPVGVVIAIAAVAAMFASFLSSQVQARKAIDKQTFKHGGLIGGKSHDSDGWGGNRYVSDNGDETYIEKDEYVVNKRSAKKYRALIEAINTDNLKSLLTGTGVQLSGERVDSYKNLKQDHVNSEIKYRIDLENAAGNKETKALREDFNKFASKQESKKNISYSNGWKIETKGSYTKRTRLK